MARLHNIKANTTTKDKFAIIAKNFGRQQVVILEQMTDFFYNSGKDPATLDQASFGDQIKTQNDQIKKLGDRLVSFIRTQEKKFLIPTTKAVEEQSIALASFLKDTEHLRFSAKKIAVKSTPPVKDDALKLATEQRDKYKHRLDMIRKIATVDKSGKIILNIDQSTFDDLFVW